MPRFRILLFAYPFAFSTQEMEALLRADCGRSPNARPHKQVDFAALAAVVKTADDIKKGFADKVARRLNADPDVPGTAPYLYQILRRKNDQDKNCIHCLCHARHEDGVLYIGCANKDSCKHATGWFHPGCVGLAAKVKNRADCERHADFVCPVCLNPEIERDYQQVFLSPDSDEEEGEDN